MNPSGYHKNLYSLEEKQESEISPLWQILQIFFYTCCIISGSVVMVCFRKSQAHLEYNCILYSNVTLFDEPKGNSIFKNDIDVIYSAHYNWHCDAVFYIPTVITAYGTFFGVLFWICGRGGAGNLNYPNSWRINMPALIFNVISFSLSIFAGSIFHGGLKYFLDNLAKAEGKKHLELNQLNDLYLEGREVGGIVVYYLKLTKHTFHMFLSFWGLNVFWLFLRCLFNVDFQLVRTTVSLYPRKPAVIYTPPSEKVMYQQQQKVSDNQENVGIRQRNVHFTPSVEKALSPNARTTEIKVKSSELPREPNQVTLDLASDADSDSVYYSFDSFDINDGKKIENLNENITDRQ